MADTTATPVKKSGWIKAGIIGVLGLGSGAVGTYATAVVNSVVKPSMPVANFAITAEGMTVTCQNRASGDNGWWDFGDGSPLEPFTPEQPNITHAYAKPGNYPIKLTVRNFLSDENDRTVPVDVGQKDLPAPQIGSFTVQPVSASSVAPATFRVLADVANAEHCVWDFGDGRLEVSDGGKIDRLVTFEKAGSFNIQAVAHNGKAVTKQAAGVKVEAPKDGTLMAVLKVTDKGSRVDRISETAAIAVAAPTGKAVRTFSKTIAARPGYVLASAAPANPNMAGFKDLKVQVSPDRRSLVLSGEWTTDTKAAKAGGGSDALIPLKLTQERTTPQSPAVTMVTGTFAAGPNRTGVASLPLPPVPFGWSGSTREYQIEIRALNQTGNNQALVQAPPRGVGSVTLPWSAGLTSGPGAGLAFQAQADGNTVRVTSTTTTPTGSQ